MWKKIVVSLSLALLLAPAADAQSGCAGDCGGDGAVTVSDLILAVNIALGNTSASRCLAIDRNSDGRVSVAELVSAVNSALNGCENVVATTTPTSSTTPTPTPTMGTPTATVPCDSHGTSSVSASSASPASGNGPLHGCVMIENAGGTRTELTRVTVRGSVNGTAYLLQVYFVTATGAVDSASYGWDPRTDFPDAFQNFHFCNAPNCAGISINLTERTIRMRSTSLSDGMGGSAVLNGTINLNFIPASEPTPTPTACPGGSTTLTFSEVQGTNPAQPIPATLVLGTAQNFSRSADPPVIALFSALYDGCPMPFPRLTLGFQFNNGFPIQAGSTYEVGIVNTQINQIEFREENFSTFRSWEAQSGTLIIDSVDESGVVSYRIVDARMRPRDIATKGTFVLNTTGTLAP